MRTFTRDARGRFASTKRTLAALGREVESEMPAKTELVYVDYRDQLTTEQVAALVRGDWETLDEQVSEWSGPASWDGAVEVVRDLAKEIVRRWEREDGVDYEDLLAEWEQSDEEMSAIDMAQSRDESDPIADLARNTGDVLLRLSIDTLDEDAAFGDEDEPTAERLLDRLGFEHSPANLSAAWEILDNAYYPGCVLMGYALVAVDVEDLYRLPLDGKVTITGPHVYLGNPFAGSGMASGPFEGTLTFDRTDLRTDRDAFGYSWTEIAGPVVSAYRGEIAAVATEEYELTDEQAAEIADYTWRGGVTE
jgi:hypothetical protein